jgi:hypothetical protein
LNFGRAMAVGTIFIANVSPLARFPKGRVRPNFGCLEICPELGLLFLGVVAA